MNDRVYARAKLQTFDTQGDECDSSDIGSGDLVLVTFMLKYYNYSSSGVKMVPHAIQLVKKTFLSVEEADKSLDDSTKAPIKQQKFNF